MSRRSRPLTLPFCPGLFDSHCHLHDEAFAEDVELVLEQAAAQGVCDILLPGTDLEDSRRILDFIERHQGQAGIRLHAALGFHPHEARNWSADAARELRELLRAEAVVALGEIGLDYHYDFSDREAQRRCFWEQLELASDLDLPLVIHDREAHGDCLEILQEACRQGLLRKQETGVFHCYSGSPEFAQELLKLGFYLGFDGPLTFKKAQQGPATLASLAAERYLLETDAPYLSPEPLRGRRNEPSYLTLVAQRAAELRGLDLDSCVAESRANCLRLFGLQ